jgi:hypothetical protein
MEALIALVGAKPLWLTPEYFVACAANTDLQAGWQPTPGDYFVCRHSGTIHRIVDPKRYASGADPIIHLIVMGPDDKRWPCDIYVPAPPDRKWVRLRASHRRPLR